MNNCIESGSPVPFARLREGAQAWETLAVEAHYRVPEFAKLCHVSVRTLQRRFKNDFELPLNQWLKELRLGRAFDQIAAGGSVKAAAYDSGFKHVSQLSRMFKERFGVSPSSLNGQEKAGRKGEATVVPFVQSLLW